MGDGQDHWNTPVWKQAAADYHRARPKDDFGELNGESIEPEPQDQAKKGPPYLLTAFETIRPNFERRGYLVKGLLPNSGLAVIWGPPKCGKSFWATDLGLHIALGWEYRGRRVTQASVVYLALEGRYGLPLRSEAFRRHHGEQSAPFYLVTEQLDLVANVDVLIACIETQLGATKPGAVFIDTLNRSLVGSESKDEDMAAYLAAAGKIEQKFNCLVAIIHHCGIDGSRPRGHTSLSGAVEVQLAVKRAASGEVMVTVELAKDFPEGAEIVSRLEPVDLGTDADGDPLTSLVVLPADASTVIRQTPARKLSDRQRLALAALAECGATIGKPAPPGLQLPASTIVVPAASWRQELYTCGLLDPDAKSPREEFRRVRNSLHARSLIGVNGEYVWKV